MEVMRAIDYEEEIRDNQKVIRDRMAGSIYDIKTKTTGWVTVLVFPSDFTRTRLYKIRQSNP